jgi:hypothetical protein
MLVNVKELSNVVQAYHIQWIVEEGFVVRPNIKNYWQRLDGVDASKEALGFWSMLFR